MVKKKAKIESKIKQLKEGDIIDLNITDKVYADVPISVENPVNPVDWELVEGEIYMGQYGYLPGHYVVYKTVDEQSSPTDFGWHVYCESVKYPYIKVHFYQGGGFYLNLDHKQVVRRAERRWVVKKDHDSGGTRIGGRDS